MKPDTGPPSDKQRRELCEMMHLIFVELRLLGWEGKSEQAADLADAFHNLPADMWKDDFDFRFFRDAFVVGYQAKYQEGRTFNYVVMIDQIMAIGD